MGHRILLSLKCLTTNASKRDLLFSARWRRIELISHRTEPFREGPMTCDKLGGRSGLRIAQNGPEQPKPDFLQIIKKTIVCHPQCTAIRPCPGVRHSRIAERTDKLQNGGLVQSIGPLLAKLRRAVGARNPHLGGPDLGPRIRPRPSSKRVDTSSSDHIMSVHRQTHRRTPQ